MPNLRWMVVSRSRQPIITGLYSQEVAQNEADILNADGLPEFAPYRVVRDLVAEACE